jgi:hypothetical protein
MKKEVFAGIILLVLLCNVSAITVEPSSQCCQISGSAINLAGRAASQQLAMSLSVMGSPSLVIIQPYNETYLRNYSIPISFIHEGGENFFYNIDNGNNVSISGNTTFSTSSGQHLFMLYANNSDGITKKSVYFTVDLTKLQINYNEYQSSNKGNSTDFLGWTYERIGNITAVLENTQSGKIEFYQLINMTSVSAVDLDTETNISYAKIYFNSNNLQPFSNKSAKISFYNISLSEPVIALNGHECNPPLCQFIDYSGNTLSFNFTKFNQTVLLEILPRIYFSNPTEQPGDIINRTDIKVNASSPIVNLKNITINLYDSSGLVDSRTTSSSSLYTDFVDLNSGIYYFNATVCNNSNYCSSTETRNVSINVTVLTKWTEIIAPQGVFEPENASLAGTHVHTFNIEFVKLTINSSETLGCIIKLSNGSLMNLDATGMNLMNVNYSLNYTLSSNDPIISDSQAGYLPWELKNCSVDSTPVYSEDLQKRIYVHSPSYWQDNEVTRAVACAGMPRVYFNNTAKCEFSKDTLFALQMRNGNPVSESCFNSGQCSSNDYCNGIFFSRCKTPSYFGGLSALSDDPNGYTTFNANFASYSTQITYTKYTNTSGTFKLRVLQALAGKTFSITIYNLTNVAGANVYGLEDGGGVTSIGDNGDGTFNVARNRFSEFTGTLDFVFNISFNSVQNQNRTLKIVLAYGIDTNQGNPAYFSTSFSPLYGLRNENEAESTSITNELNGVCGDNVNNDFDYLGSGGIFGNSYDCYDSDCNLNLGAVQTNEFGSGKNGLCNYQVEMNCTDQYDNDYSGLADCHDINCFHNTSKQCPVAESICNDSLDNDWDYTNSADPIGNNGSRYGIIGTTPLTDCQDIDCNGSLGTGGTCNWGYETICNDGFNNDALQLKDCDVNTLTGSTTMPSINDAEYDCSSYCRLTTSTETGSSCNDNKDNDLDAIIITGYYTGIANTSYGAGIDCRWGGYFGIGSNYNPDEDCNQTILSNGKQCQLMREINCTDGFDNDYDHNALGMPHAGWASNPSAYQAYFNQSFVNYADYDDYDCKSNLITPSSESVNASWCFDGIDNNLDTYYFNGTNYVLNSSTGTDCADPTCANIVNPANPSQGCFAFEYNSSNPSFNDSARCADSFDNDLNGLTDCSDLSCFRQFDACSIGQCKSQENISWNSCADGINNDYSGGTDCADVNCNGVLGGLAGALCGNEVCNDNFDNDANGLADCSDHSACDNQLGGRMNDIPVYCRASESSACFDSFDNDADGKVDCYDEDCNAACNLSTISGTTPINLPVTSSMALNSVSDASISNYTRQTRNGEYYIITMKMTSQSTNAQWTLGTASKPFNKSAFDVSTATLAGADMASFSLTETQNGFIISSDHASLSLGYEIIFMIKSQGVLENSIYELTYAEEKNSQISLGNNVYHEVNENVLPIARSIQVSSSGNNFYARANISDSNLGSCLFNINGITSESTNCKTSFTPVIEGIYDLNVTPKDYYSNIGNSMSKQHNVNLIPVPVSIDIDRAMPFYHTYDLVVVNASFNVVSTDSLGNCEIIAKNSTSEISLGSFSASGNKCIGTPNISSLSDGEYIILAKVTETTENNIVESNSTSLFVCSNSQGLCKYADFNDDSKPDLCPDLVPAGITIAFPPQNSQLTAGTTQTYINISTNEIAFCKYSLNKNFDFSNGISFTNTNSLKHSFLLSVSAESYNLYYKCNDTSGNVNTLSVEHNFSVASSISPPAPPIGGGGGGGIVCSQNKECRNMLGKGYKCKNGVCVLLEGECESDEDCDSGQYCQFGKCLPLGKPAPVISVISEAISNISKFVSSNGSLIIESIVITLGTLAVLGIIVPMVFKISLWNIIIRLVALLRVFFIKNFLGLFK